MNQSPNNALQPTEQTAHELCRRKARASLLSRLSWVVRLLSTQSRGGAVIRNQIERAVLVVLVVAAGLNEIFHTVFDGLEFKASAQFVGTVLSMQSTSEPSSWRAISSPTVAIIAYGLIWLAHAASGVFCLAGAYFLARVRKDDTRFSQSAAAATAGLGIGCILYLLGFEAIAGGWFLLYQAPTPPNFIPEADRLFLCYAAVLIYLHLVVPRRTAA